MSLYHKYRPATFDEVVGNVEVVAALKSDLAKEDHPHAFLLHGPTGCGKTTLGRIIATELSCSEDDFKEVDSADFRGIDTVREIRRQSQYKPLSGKCRVWLLDECFAKGTKIAMRDGSLKNIEDVHVGDFVINLAGYGKVLHTFRNKVPLNRVVKLTLSNAETIFCSKDHLFYTINGWKKAINLNKTDLLSTVFCDTMDAIKPSQRSELNGASLSFLRETSGKGIKKILQSNLSGGASKRNNKKGNQNLSYLPKNIYSTLVFTKYNLFSKMWKYIRRTEKNRDAQIKGSHFKTKTNFTGFEIYKSSNIQKIGGNAFKTNENFQSYAQSKVCKKDDDYQTNKWHFTCMERGTRGKWEVHTCPTITSTCFGVANGSSDSYQMQTRGTYIPYLLQGRCRRALIENSNRSRWELTQLEENKEIRQKEREQIANVRVESIEIYQRGNNDESFKSIIEDTERNQGYVIFYDMEVDTNASYTANGVFVHNCHKLTNDAQSALLKALEDTPPHVYYILATTDPQKLIATIKGRCSQYQVKQLTDSEMMTLLRSVVKTEGQKLTKEVYEQIIMDSQGHPRNALQILDQVLGVPAEMRIEVAKRAAEVQSDAIELCRVLMQKAPWKKVAGILTKLKDQDPESIRRLVLSYCNTILLKGENMQAGLVMEQFIEPFYNTGFPGLTFACFSIVCGEN